MLGLGDGESGEGKNSLKNYNCTAYSNTAGATC